jgi:hypothetical protein
VGLVRGGLVEAAELLEDRMPHPLTLPVVAGLALLGTGAGLWLGNSAISQINPVYYSEAEDRFHADLVPYRSPDWAQVQVTEYQDAGLIEGLGSGCIGCRTWPEEYVPRSDPGMDGVEDGWAASTAYSPTEVQAALAEAPDDPEWEQVGRYASYQVSADERAEEEADRAALRAESAEEEEREPIGL